MIYQNLSWFYRLKMVISQFATVKIQRLNHPKLSPWPKGNMDSKERWLGRRSGGSTDFSLFAGFRHRPMGIEKQRGQLFGWTLEAKISQTAQKKIEKNNANLGDFELSFGGRWLRWFFWIHHSWVDSDKKKKQGGFGIDDAFHHLPSPSRFL